VPTVIVSVTTGLAADTSATVTVSAPWFVT
jgi:hypothetical protein